MYFLVAAQLGLIAVEENCRTAQPHSRILKCIYLITHELKLH